MSNRAALFTILVGASACAARAPSSPTFARYSCGTARVVRDGAALAVLNDESALPTTLGWKDDDGDHYVSWPHSTTQFEAVEYVLPHDNRSDAMMRKYDTSKGLSTADWRITQQQTCRAEGGYNDALARWMDGASIDQVASSVGVDTAEARNLVHHALITLQRRYAHDRFAGE